MLGSPHQWPVAPRIGQFRHHLGRTGSILLLYLIAGEGVSGYETGRPMFRPMDADTQTLTPMPDGFCWKPRCHLDTLPTGLFLHGVQVASMQQRVDGSWLARLSHEDGLHAPLLLRRAARSTPAGAGASYGRCDMSRRCGGRWRRSCSGSRTTSCSGAGGVNCTRATCSVQPRPARRRQLAGLPHPGCVRTGWPAPAGRSHRTAGRLRRCLSGYQQARAGHATRAQPSPRGRVGGDDGMQPVLQGLDVAAAGLQFQFATREALQDIGDSL